LKAFFLIVPGMSANAMAIYPFILLKDKKLQDDPALVNHERIHLQQQIELLVLPFYLLYLLHYLVNLLVYKRHHQAYLNIVFEKEAYACEQRLDYLKNRKLFSWTKYC